MDHRAEILAKIFDVILSWPDEENETARDVDGDTGRQVDKVTPSIPSPILPDNCAEGDSERRWKNLKIQIAETAKSNMAANWEGKQRCRW